VTPAQIADVLDLAVEELEANPWGQGLTRYSNEADRGICAIDALSVVIAGKVRPHSAMSQVLFDTERAVMQTLTLNPRLMSLANWNDVPGRTKQQVIDAFKNTAKDLRNQA
jgi:hypothetical protein